MGTHPSRQCERRVIAREGAKAVFGVKTHGHGEMEGLGPFVAVNVVCLDLEPDALAALPVEHQDGARDAWDRAPEVTGHL